ncbi:MAG: 7-cyano-7-deazaguanine synthase QueC [Candidatus Peregrinibacteria bacterium]|nr:7-cyano-7-deazaguanine synthase QueC [Candidatus Peregrinibacteria bacterium]
MKKALVLHSGGQDSTTCLAWAMKKFDEIETVSFDYGQRHKVELQAAKRIAKKLKLKHTVLKTDIFSQLGKNALTHNIKITKGKNGLPTTFVPGRNIFFLTVAAAYAYSHGITDIVTGVCQTDYSGYPDCRDATIRSLEKTLTLGMDYKLKIHTPLMFLTKAQTVEMIDKLGYFDLLADTHTCYEGSRPPCGKCPSCKLRAKGFKEAKKHDPLLK